MPELLSNLLVLEGVGVRSVGVYNFSAAGYVTPQSCNRHISGVRVYGRKSQLVLDVMRRLRACFVVCGMTAANGLV